MASVSPLVGEDRFYNLYARAERCAVPVHFRVVSCYRSSQHRDNARIAIARKYQWELRFRASSSHLFSNGRHDRERGCDFGMELSRRVKGADFHVMPEGGKALENT